jgi:hypothetical protein
MNQEIAINQYKSHTGNVGDLHFKKIGNNLVDIFSGEGFNNPTRLRLIKGAWQWIAGPKLHAKELVPVITAL